jgi:hypothetical protein
MVYHDGQTGIRAETTGLAVAPQYVASAREKRRVGRIEI